MGTCACMRVRVFEVSKVSEVSEVSEGVKNTTCGAVTALKMTWIIRVVNSKCHQHVALRA